MSGHRVATALAAAAVCAWLGGVGAPAALAGKCTPRAAPNDPNVLYKTLDNGGQLKVDVFFAAGSGRHPAVVLLDGGSWKSSCKEDVGPDARSLAQQGFVAFAPNVSRACTGRNKLCGFHAPAPVVDVRDLLLWIRSSTIADRYLVDAANVGVMGISSGGQLAYMLGETGTPGSTRPDAVAGFSGDADMPFACDAGILSVCADRANYIGCSLNACRSMWAANNPTALAIQAAAPTFIVSGTNDKRVRIDEAQHLDTALANAGAAVTLCEVKSGQHSQDLYPLPCTTGGAQSSWDRMVAFFNAHL